MDESMTINKYKILDTLYNDEFQSIYICIDTEANDEKKYMLGEFFDDEIIAAIKDSFRLSDDQVSKSAKETFEIDNKFYAVFPVIKGTTLEEFLKKHKLTIADKMYTTDELFKQFLSINKSDYAIQYVLCDMNNISVLNRKQLFFNNIFFFKKENLKVKYIDIIKRISYIIFCIFANSPEVDINRQKDLMPPAILSLFLKANGGVYDSVESMYEDFKKTLLYTTFIDTGSLDNQIRQKIFQAKKKRQTPWGKYIGVALFVLFLLAGLWIAKDKGVFSIKDKETGKTVIEQTDKKGKLPVADFSMSISKIYKEDEVVFIDKSRPSKSEDEIKHRLWDIKKNGAVILNSDKEILSYKFNETGEYEISLIVQDSKGNKSQPYTHNISVLEKTEFPDTSESGDEKDSVLK